MLQVLCCYRLMDPGSEWRLHRTWFERCGLGDLLGADFSLAAKDTLYRAAWIYELTSTYFESDPPLSGRRSAPLRLLARQAQRLRASGHALVLTPEGFPLAYVMIAGNTTDKTTLRAFLQKSG